jgi:hypothetical protein
MRKSYQIDLRMMRRLARNTQNFKVLSIVPVRESFNFREWAIAVLDYTPSQFTQVFLAIQLKRSKFVPNRGYRPTHCITTNQSFKKSDRNYFFPATKNPIAQISLTSLSVAPEIEDSAILFYPLIIQLLLSNISR